jgi:hypothetical protein
MKAEIIDKDGRTIATGYAEEHRTASQINRTSALENCETSAIGRALANFGLGGGEYASADEVANAINQQEKVTINVPKYQKSNLNFDDIREHLKTLKTTTEVNAYANEVSKAYPNPTDKQRYTIQTMFSERREDIVNGARTAK